MEIRKKNKIWRQIFSILYFKNQIFIPQDDHHKRFEITLIMHLGNYSFLLIDTPCIAFSSLGDADLYISDTNMYPTYEPDSYSLHSATCGDEIIVIPER